MASNQVLSDFISGLPEERQAAVQQLRDVIAANLPQGFEESIGSGMIHFVVPRSLYPAGYHCAPNQPLPFISIGNTKGHISLHHMGLYANPEMLHWFEKAYPNYVKTKLDMGKGCVRFKKPDTIPFALIKELVKQMTPADWVKTYEAAFKNKEVNSR